MKLLCLYLMKNTKVSYILLFSFLLLSACAKQGMPTGGNKDVTPPKTLRMTPPSGSLNNLSKDFYIDFDEYVVLKNVENNILVSPPMKQRPEVKTKGKGIKVTILDTLQPNTTYLFQFKEAIADFNEGNLLPSLEYVFSTGDYIDSMSVSGNVVEALSLTPDKDPLSVWLMDEERYLQAIKALGDTNFKAPQPNYITRTDNEGRFSFNNIKPGQYHVIAIKDEDKNNVIDATETIAFLDSTMTAYAMASKSDSTDTSGYRNIKPSTITPTTTLRLYTPKSERQRLTSNNFIETGKAVITSLLPLASPQLNAGDVQVVWRLNSKRDTLTLWTLNKDCDSLQLIVTDTTGINDTLDMKWHSRKKTQKSAPAKLPKQEDDMSFSTTSLHYFDSLWLSFKTPLDTNRCRLDSVAVIMLLKDSSIEYCSVCLDSSAMRAYLLYRFRQGENYSVTIRGGLFTDIYGSDIDSLQSKITVSKAEDYGNLTLKVTNTEADSNDTVPLIVELLDEKGNVLKDKKLNSYGTLKFSNIKPAKYRVRVIIDSNGNGIWDIGDFASQRQPERVVYLDKTLDIRANWDFEEELKVNN